MDATQESISWETYLAAGIKALDLSSLRMPRSYSKGFVKPGRTFARLRGDETEGDEGSGGQR